VPFSGQRGDHHGGTPVRIGSAVRLPEKDIADWIERQTYCPASMQKPEVWVNPNGLALAFLRKPKAQPGKT